VELSNGKTVLTRKGYDDIQRELEEISRRRPAIVQRIREAMQLGDLSENFDYHDAKREQGMLEGRIAELKAILNNSTIIDCTEANGCIGVGSMVVVRDVEEGFEDEYMIVGPPESNPSEGKISYESSVGAALLGHKAGDTVSITCPGGEFQYEILSVE
jgi:transcription elongation factor GreA